MSEETKLPIPYARIGIENSELGTTSDENGVFSIDLSKSNKGQNIKI